LLGDEVMSDFTWNGNRVSDGAALKLTSEGAMEYVPSSTSDIFIPPVGTNVVQIENALLPIAAINPDAFRNSFPGSRGLNELILYTRGTIALVTQTNQYGVEIACSADGTVLSINNRIAVGKTDGTVIPPNGYVLSGHGQRGEQLLAAASVGGKVVLSHRDVMPTPDESNPGTPLPGVRLSNIAVWIMTWPNSPRVDLGKIPTEVDEIRLSFLINDGRMVGDGPAGLSTMRGELQKFLNARTGRFVSVAVGGGGYTISIPSVTKYIDNIKVAEKHWGITFGGLNWDWEADSFKANAANTIAISRALKKERGNGFYVSWSPNGSYKWDYSQVCQSAPDVVDELGFQNYDTEVSYDTSYDITKKLRGSSLRADQMGSAMMIENNNRKRWTLEQCIVNTQRLRNDLGVRKVALWEGGRAQSVQWYAAMRNIVR